MGQNIRTEEVKGVIFQGVCLNAIALVLEGH